MKQMQSEKGVPLLGLCPLAATQSPCCGIEAGSRDGGWGTWRGSGNLSTSAITVDFLMTTNQLHVTLSNKGNMDERNLNATPLCESSAWDP